MILWPSKASGFGRGGRPLDSEPRAYRPARRVASAVSVSGGAFTEDEDEASLARGYARGCPQPGQNFEPGADFTSQ